MRKRQQISAELKAKIALTTIKSELTVSQISSQYKVHANQVSKWKKQLLEGAVDIFSRARSIREEADKQQVEELFKTIGQLTVENEWLKKKSKDFAF